MIKKILVGSLALIVIVCVAGGGYLYVLVTADVDEVFAGSCTERPLDGSGEDIQIDHERGYAYISLLDRMAIAKGEEVAPGSILRLDLNDTAWPVVPALLDGPALRPHGLTLHKSSDGRQNLLVINHPVDRASGAERIERYVETTPGNFSHAETFSSPLITRANDMVAVGPREFYVAQDVAQRSGDTVTQLIYFDGEDYTAVADDIASGGGINVSPDLSTLYISETGAKRLRVAEINVDGSLGTETLIDLGTSPDNIDIAEDGSLWIGAHSNVAALAMHFIAGAKAPSQILRVDLQAATPQIEEIYLNAGNQISASSVGATWGNKLLIGSITARKILVCEMDPPAT